MNWRDAPRPDVSRDRREASWTAVEASFTAPPSARRWRWLLLTSGLIAGVATAAGVEMRWWVPRPLADATQPAEPRLFVPREVPSPEATELPGLDAAIGAPALPESFAIDRSQVKNSLATSSVAVDDLFVKASEFRRRGRPELAAKLFAGFLRDHGNDSRAGLAAFQLGLLYSAELSSNTIALKHFKLAWKLSAGAVWREELAARLVLTYDRLQRVESCERARERYAREYPAGVHTERLKTLCHSSSP